MITGKIELSEESKAKKIYTINKIGTEKLIEATKENLSHFKETISPFELAVRHIHLLDKKNR